MSTAEDVRRGGQDVVALLTAAEDPELDGKAQRVGHLLDDITADPMRAAMALTCAVSMIAVWAEQSGADPLDFARTCGIAYADET